MPDTPIAALPLARDAMARAARAALAAARAKGAGDAEVEVSAAVGQSVTVRRGEVETVEYNRDKGLSVTVYFGRRRGNASTSDLVEEAIEVARRTEAAALAVDRRISNSEGATVSAYDSDFVLANSLGFESGFATSKSSVSCGVVAEDAGGMQRDYWYTTHRDPARLEAAESVGRMAGTR